MAETKCVDVSVVGSYFESMSDPRHLRNRKHLLNDIMVISICGIIGNASGPTAIHRWAKARSEWLGKFLQLPNGISWRDCIRRTLIAIKPLALQQCFEVWTRDLMKTDDTNGKILVAIFGQIHQGMGA